MRTAYGGEAKKSQTSERAIRRDVYNNLTTGFTSTVDVEKSSTCCARSFVTQYR